MKTSKTPSRLARTLLLASAISVTLAACGSGGGTQASASGNMGDGGHGTGGTSGTGGGAPIASPIIYLADQATLGVDELYMVQPSAPGGAIKVSAPLVTGGSVYDFLLSADGQHVVYIADQDIDGRYEIYRVSLANPGVATKLNPPLSVNRDVMDFVASQDGTKIVYRSDAAIENLFELYLVDLANPGTSIKLSGALTAGGSVRGGYMISPDDARVLYRADQELVERVELYSVAIAAPGVSTKINAPLVLEGDVTTGIAFSPDSTRVAYIADQDTDGTLELYGVALSNPGAATKLNAALTTNGDVCQFEFSPDSQRVAYCADQDTDEVIELYTVALSAPAVSSKLNPALVGGGDVIAGYEFSTDSSSVVYLANQDDASKVELYRVAIATPGVSSKLNRELVAGGDVWDFQFRPDGTHVGYVATQDSLSIYELYEVALANPGVSTKLNGLVSGAGLWQFEYSDDSTRAFYTAEENDGPPQLYRVDITTPGTATKLNGPIVQGGGVWGFVSSPWSLWIP